MWYWFALGYIVAAGLALAWWHGVVKLGRQDWTDD